MSGGRHGLGPRGTRRARRGHERGRRNHTRPVRVRPWGPPFDNPGRPGPLPCPRHDTTRTVSDRGRQGQSGVDRVGSPRRGVDTDSRTGKEVGRQRMTEGGREGNGGNACGVKTSVLVLFDPSRTSRTDPDFVFKRCSKVTNLTGNLLSVKRSLSLQRCLNPRYSSLTDLVSVRWFPRRRLLRLLDDQ